MRETFSLGRLAGIRVGVNWSVLVIFVLIALGLAEGRLPEAHPDGSWWQYWLVGLAAAVVFFASLLAHEIAHAVVARRNGVHVDGIVLWMLGGAARLRSEAPNPGAELRIAGVGPLVSLVLGVVFGLLAGVLGGLLGGGLAVEAVAWLAAINVLLALFNVLPAAPLDGGRLLRAVVWWRTGSRLRATRAATVAGRALGWALVVLGLYLLVAGAGFSGVWLAIIGWFLVAAATMEGSQAQLRELLSGIPVRQAMTADPVTVPETETLAEFLEGPRYRYRHSAFPVVAEDGSPRGLITLRRARDVPEERQATATVADAMLPAADVPTAGPEDPLAQLLPELQAGDVRRALVVADDRLVGIISSSDLGRILSWLTSTTPWATRR
ncbi:site-2 protease family protein [Streptomyces sp. JJ36]|uniref:site-2 protease family protein n=1 Tax=Streptomyces sp. JJ36 TaxID=2736645 RepID=UPI001F1920A3|nr:site-2 protease family protein [Streptomyces sp. JJ36]MCF6524498.1 site-2 protease family protein [Streptomyces sp. JJ36]